MYKTTDNVISNNIIDRNSEYGIKISFCSKNVINGNFLRRNNIETTINSNNCQVRFESCSDIIFTNNELKKGNTRDDGSGVIVPVYAMYIVYSHDLLFMGNDFSDSCTEPEIIKQYSNTGGIQFLDLGFDILDLLTGSEVKGAVTSTTPLTLIISGDKASASGYPMSNKYMYYIRRTDTGAYESGELILSNFAL